MVLARFLTKRVETSLHVIIPFIELDLISLEKENLGNLATKIKGRNSL